MKNPTSLKTTLGMAAIALFALFNQVQAADNLEGVLKEGGWETIVGTWQDPDGNTTTFSWKYPSAVLQSVTKMGDVERYSMLWRNVKTETVSIVSADNKGGSSHGDCTFSGGGKAVFAIEFASHDGKAGRYNVNYALDGDNLTVQIEGHPTSVTLTRK